MLKNGLSLGICGETCRNNPTNGRGMETFNAGRANLILTLSFLVCRYESAVCCLTDDVGLLLALFLAIPPPILIHLCIAYTYRALIITISYRDGTIGTPRHTPDPPTAMFAAKLSLVKRTNKQKVLDFFFSYLRKFEFPAKMCGSFIGVTSHGLSCEVCKFKSHKRCAVKAINNCKWTTLASVGKDIIEDDEGVSGFP
jgi:hypothetical protein